MLYELKNNIDECMILPYLFLSVYIYIRKIIMQLSPYALHL